MTIAALAPGPDDLPHTARSSAGTGQVLDDLGSRGGGPCIAVDAANDPPIACYDADTGSLEYAAWAPWGADPSTVGPGDRGYSRTGAGAPGEAA